MVDCSFATLDELFLLKFRDSTERLLVLCSRCTAECRRKSSAADWAPKWGRAVGEI